MSEDLPREVVNVAPIDHDEAIVDLMHRVNNLEAARDQHRQWHHAEAVRKANTDILIAVGCIGVAIGVFLMWPQAGPSTQSELLRSLAQALK